MPYRDDWEQARERLMGWWAGEDIGRPAVYATAPSGRSVKHPEPPDDIAERWTNIEYRVAAALATYEATCYLAEAHPYVFVNFGPSFMAAFIGCEPVFHEGTVWQEPCLRDWSQWEPHFDPDNRWWRLAVEFTEALCEAGRDRWLASYTDFGDAFDVLSYMRGPERLCMDLVEHREQVVAAADWITDLWLRLYDELDAIFQRYGQDGRCGWLPIWAPSTTYPLQCDFSCMVGPAEFDELIRPRLLRLAKHIEYPTYHWDGPGALQHAASLLSMEELLVIQWVPGAGQPGPARWVDLLRTIVAAGKRIHIGCSPQELLELVHHVPYQAIFAQVSGFSSADEARAFLRRLEEVCKEVRPHIEPIEPGAIQHRPGMWQPR